MILKQFYLGCLAQASYLVADEQSKVAAIVDPRRDVDDYLEQARKLGVEIRHVVLTHFHADFVSGHLELRDRCGAKIHLGARAEAEYAFVPMKDGTRLELGPSTRLEALETPGHTPEGISVLVYDLAKDPSRPHAVLTGDALFIGDVGRPDLLASKGLSAEDLAGMLYDSLHEKLMKLPDETLVYPAHGAGSLCGKNLSDENVSTIGKQKKQNYALKPMAKSEFVKLVTSEQAWLPGYFAYDAELNKRERPTLEKSLESSLEALSPDGFLELVRGGAQVVDTRSPADFEAGYLEGSINIGLGGKYATWAGTVLDREKPIVIVCDAGKERESVVRLARIGFDQVRGYLDASKLPKEKLGRRERVTAEELSKRLQSQERPVVLDVRAVGEWNASRIEGAVLIPLHELKGRWPEVPRGKPIVIHCAGGYRSSIAASILARHGIETSDLVGGMSAWEAAKLPTVRS